VLVIVDGNEIRKALDVQRDVGPADDAQAVGGRSPEGGATLGRRAAGGGGGATQLVVGVDQVGGRRRSRSGVVRPAAGRRRLAGGAARVPSSVGQQHRHADGQVSIDIVVLMDR